MGQDVFKILKDLEMKIVGLDPTTNKMQEGYFVSYRTVGLPIVKDDYIFPWSPLGSNLEKDIPQTNASDPANAPKTGSGSLDTDKIFTANIAKSQQSYLNTFMLTDDKLRMNNQYSVMPGAGKVSDAWWAIITGANGIPTESVLNDSMKAAYDAATSKLMDKDGNVTPHYQAYMQYEDTYKSKVKAWHRAYANAMTDPMKMQNWPIDGVQYQDDADEAMDRWVGLGFKQEIETAIATLAAQGIDPSIALISRAKKRYINSLNEFTSVGEIPYTLMLPNTWYDKDSDDGWYQYSSQDFHTEAHYSSSSTSYGGSANINVGFWSVGGGFEHSEQQSSVAMQTDDLEITFSYCAVDIKRPWLEADLLNLQNWFLMGDYKKGCISNGTMGQELPSSSVPQTFLPSVVTSLILIKDLRIKWKDAQLQWEQQCESTTASGSVGYGPFALNGHYKHRDEQSDFTMDIDGEGLYVEGIQLIGYISMINPVSPGVDSSQYLQKVAQTPATTADQQAATKAA
ncbi:hypothetical protein [Paraburkholderia terrae]|uniref:hypothetical protein n=1 Tax=Paraburkholderia terrae TaxID=311230 RepID=UPI00204D13D0|nr:hypothetical protein [Paraburkholderia terrae]BDC46044.1 hypothetical protein PTKU15_93410 [Paraburkholderia terrae]